MTFKTIVMICGIVCCFVTAQSQTDSVYYNTEWKMGKLYRHDPTGIPKIQHQGLQINDHPRIDVRDPDAQEVPPSFQNPTSRKTNQVNGTVVGVGRNFEGNHLYNGIPADNAIAISDSGLIVSFDNESIAYFKENGDTVVKYGLSIDRWAMDSTHDRGLFDPRLLYDRHQNRFIAVAIYHSIDYSESRIVVGFSKPLLADSIEWKIYQLSIDSIYTEAGQTYYWADYPNIGQNKDELFIGVSVLEHIPGTDTNYLRRTLVAQIDKSAGYAAAPNIVCKEWPDVKNADNNRAGEILPVSDAFQSPDYGPGCYLLSNYSANSTKIFWYELTGGINDPNAMIVRHLTATSMFYSHPSYATQMGGNGQDRILFQDCGIHTGIYQNGKLHFVMHRSDNGWGEIVYGRIKISDNSFFFDTWGGSEENLNSMYPSMAPFGGDSSEESFMIAFSRTGPTIFPELCVINYDSGWSIQETVVRSGLGLINLRNEIAAPWDSLERIGDYTAIQRRYNDPSNACWLSGSYAAGPTPNHFGVVNGIKTWIAEVGDSAIVGIKEPFAANRFLMYPTPVRPNEFLNFVLPGRPVRGFVKLHDLNGRIIFNTDFDNSSFSLKIPDIVPGIYFVELITNKDRYAAQKILIHH